jgi:tetratricopeptide (TPR) repeat protein
VHNLASLGDTAWDTCEQIILAALDCNQIVIALAGLRILQNQFSSSSRVNRLKCMLLEAQGEWQRALEVYNSILQTYPTDPLIMKRQIAIYKGQGDMKMAASLLATYLEIWMADIESWLELASLHISLLQYKEAFFCYEELILAAPQNYLFYLKYAEILYTVGGLEKFKLARKYFTYSLELNYQTNHRGLWGVAVCNLAIASFKGKQQEKEDCHQIYEYVEKKMKELYKGSSNYIVVEETLQKLSTLPTNE